MIMSGALISSWLAAFALTQLIEIPIHARALRGDARRWLYAFTASALTHPFVYIGFTLIMTPGTVRYALVAESFAVGVEAWWLRRCSNGRLQIADALLWSLVANAASVAVGSTLDALWPG
jgi:hypothetical protein